MPEDINTELPLAEVHSSRLTFPKSERLRHRTLVEGVFGGRNTLYDYPLRMSWRALDEAELRKAFRDMLPEGIAPLQMMVTVPKKKLRHAVDRVRMRRLIREAYRLQRRPVRAAVEEHTPFRTLSVAFVYMAKELLPMEVIERKMASLLQKLRQRILPAEETSASAPEVAGISPTPAEDC